MIVMKRIYQPGVGRFKRMPATFFVMLSVVMLGNLLSIPALAQLSEEEHKSHHPETYGKTASPDSETQSFADTEAKAYMAKGQGMGQGMGKGMGQGMGQGMDKMMEKMGAPKPKDLYPSLMRLPNLPLEQRDKVEGDAQRRMSEGIGVMLRGFDALSRATERQDFTQMQLAVSDIEQGLAQYDSGLAAKRALAEGHAPRNVALHWFKREMNLLPTLSAESTNTVLGMSPFHTGVMLILLLFVAVMAWMYLYKMRRAAALLNELRQRVAIPEQRENTELTTAATGSKPSQTVPIQVHDNTGGEKHSANLDAKQLPTKGAVYSGKLKVIGIFSETHDVKTFRLAEPEGDPLPFTYEPGQFVTFTLAIPEQGKPVKRSYTIASSPTQRDFIEVTIKREEQGLVSRYMHDMVRHGDLLEVKAPNGRFYFNGKNAQSVVLVSGGVGVTPMMSAVRFLTNTCWPGEIYFLFCTRTSNDFIFQQELEYLQARHKNLHVLVSMTRAEGTSWMGPEGRFTPELISNFVPNIESKEIHICGPKPMMDGISSMLTALGVPKTQIKTEAFGPAPSPKKPLPSAPSVGPLPSGETLSAQFIRSNKTVTVTEGETLLDAAEAADIDIENSCRAGSCGSCKIKLISGTVTMDVDDGLEEGDRSKGYILACQAIPTSDIKVEA